jgi:hypothetical protein
LAERATREPTGKKRPAADGRGASAPYHTTLATFNTQVFSGSHRLLRSTDDGSGKDRRFKDWTGMSGSTSCRESTQPSTRSSRARGQPPDALFQHLCCMSFEFIDLFSHIFIAIDNEVCNLAYQF